MGWQLVVDVTKVDANAGLSPNALVADAPAAGTVATKREEGKVQHYVEKFTISATSVVGFGVQQDGSCGKSAHGHIRLLAEERARQQDNTLPFTVLLRLVRERVSVSHIRGIALFVQACVSQWRRARAKARAEQQAAMGGGGE